MSKMTIATLHQQKTPGPLPLDFFLTSFL